MKMFHFGRNWKNYVMNVVDDKVVEEAKQSLLRYLPEEVYRGSRFLDIGCGSGLFSLSAYLLGCKEVVSFDIDKESIKALEILVNKFKDKYQFDFNRWSWFQGNILDDALVKELEKTKFDIVYSWGVLHHTGNMYKAIENAAKLVKKDGYFIIAIYNHAPSSPTWLKIKKFYNHHKLLQPLLELLYGSYAVLGYIVRRRTFKLRTERGMHVFYDAIDWIGGYPYEFACFDEIKSFVENLGFELIKAPTRLPCGKDKKAGFLGSLRKANTGCNEFVFRKL